MQPHFVSGGLSLYFDCCLSVLPQLAENSVDTVICDPPYELGFMGKKWDSTGVAFRPETWAAILRVCRPGSMLLAFGGTRTFHRLTCAIEDAGWEIRDCLMWLYGQGWPKSKSLLKPAWEPIVMARKAGRLVPVNIDDCRANGRWPANLLLDEESAAQLDLQSGELTSGTGAVKRSTSAGYKPNALGTESRPEGTAMVCYGDTGGASRFFYKAKVSSRERGESKHPTMKPIDLVRYLVRLTKTPTGGIVLDPFAGSGTTGLACRQEGRDCILIESDGQAIDDCLSRLGGTA